MRTTLTVTITLLLTVTPLLLTSCTPGPLEGDWFICEDETCTALDDEGIRFTADGRWSALEAPGGSFEPGEPYELEGPSGSYSLEGEILSLQIDGTNETKAIRISFDPSGDLLIHDVEVGTTACAEPAPSTEGITPPTTCEEQTESLTVRLRRVGDAGDVPPGGGTVDDDDRVYAPAPPSSGGGN